MAFKDRNYNGRTTIATVAGRMTHEHVLDMMGPVLGKLPAGRTPRFSRARPIDVSSPVEVRAVKQEIEQTHVALGFHAFGRADDRRYALKLLSVILGENMSSRLFQKLRERLGYCYSVQSGVVSLEDTGALTIFAGLDPAKLEKALKAILDECWRTAERPPTRGELRKAQDYTIGQTLMGLESTTNQMMWMGESILGYGKVLDPSEVESRLLAVTPEEVRAVAEFCFCQSRPALAAIGLSPDGDRIRTLLERR